MVRPNLYPFYSSNIKQCFQKYCETAYAREVASNQMSILKNPKEVLEHLKSLNFNLITSIKSHGPFDFSILLKTIHLQTPNSMLATITQNTLIYQSGNRSFRSRRDLFCRGNTQIASILNTRIICLKLSF